MCIATIFLLLTTSEKASQADCIKFR